MPRPSSLPRWDSTQVNLVVPPSGVQDVGFAVGGVPVSGYQNWYQNNVYQWLAWLNAGDLSDGAWHFGNTEIASLVFDGAALFGSTTSMLDDCTMTGNKNFHVSGTGAYKHGTKTLRLPAGIGLPQTNSESPWNAEAGGVAASTGTGFQWQVVIPLQVGKRITAWRARVKDSATGPTALTFITTSSVDATETGLGGAGTVSAGSGNWQTLTRTFNYTVTAGENIYGTVFTSSGSAAVHFAWIEVDYDEL